MTDDSTIAEKIIEALDDSGELPKPHKAAMLVVSVVAGFVAKDVVQKMYKTGFKMYRAKKASE